MCSATHANGVEQIMLQSINVGKPFNQHFLTVMHAIFTRGKFRLKLTLIIQDKLRSAKIVTEPDPDPDCACVAVGD